VGDGVIAPPEEDGLVESEGDELPPPVPPLSPPPQAAKRPLARLSAKAKIKILLFITPLSPIAAIIMNRSLITIPHLLSFLKRCDRIGFDLGIIHSPKYFLD